MASDPVDLLGFIRSIQLRVSILFIGICWFSCTAPPKSDHVVYVRQAFDSIRAHSIRQEFNFDSLETSVIGQLNGNSKMEDVHVLLHHAVHATDHHGFVSPSENCTGLLNGSDEAVPERFPFSGKILKEKYAYVDVLPFGGVDSVSADNYVDSLQRLLFGLYNQDPAGWIIDLRTNTGGNPYAMVGGLGALLGEGTLVSSISHSGESHDHFYARTDSTGKFEKLELVDSAYLFEKQLPISVLVGPETGSAAEVLTLGFMSLPHARTLGQPTYGVTTGLYPVILPDSACMFITHSIDHDRFGNAYDGPIDPDVLIEDPLELFEQSYEFIDSLTQD